MRVNEVPWSRVREWVEKRQQTALDRIWTKDLPERETADLRTQMAVYKDLLALEKHGTE